MLDKRRPYQAVPDLITIFAGVNSKAWEEQGSFAGDSAQVEQEQPAEGRPGITSPLSLPSLPYSLPSLSKTMKTKKKQIYRVVETALVTYLLRLFNGSCCAGESCGPSKTCEQSWRRIGAPPA